MNWYKKAQKIPTMENIIWAIDKIIAENYEFTVEELSQASQALNEQQYALPKAAQTATKKRYKTKSKFNDWYNDLSYEEQEDFDNSEEISSTESKIFDLFEEGVSNKNIAKRLGITTSEVSKVIKTKYPSKKEQMEYQRDISEKNVLNTYDEMAENMMADFNIKSINVKQISSVLGVNASFVRETITKNGIDLSKLIPQRRDRIAQLIAGIAKELNYNFTHKQIQAEFEQRYNFRLTPSTINRAVKLNNLKQRTDSDNIFQSFLTYIDSMVKGGRKRVVETMPEQLLIYIDRFFQQYGEKHGFIPPYEQETLKRMFLTKIQMEKNMTNMERYKYTPVDYSENNPATFLYNRDQGQNELV